MNSMKHFVIGVIGKSCVFEFKCSTAHEAYEAIMDASCGFNIEIDADRIMEKLVEIKNGRMLSHHGCRLSIRFEDGEV